MSVTTIKFKTTTECTRISDKIEFYTGVCNGFVTSETDVPVPPVTVIAWRADLAILNTNYPLSRNHIKSATIIVKECIIREAGIYKQQVIYVQGLCNTAESAELGVRLGMKEVKVRTPFVKPPLTIKNTPVLGFLFFDIKTFKKVRMFNIECTLITDGVNGAPVLLEPVTNPKSTIGGFVSGAKYLFRAQPVFSGNVKGEWTDYVAIRVN